MHLDEKIKLYDSGLANIISKKQDLISENDAFPKEFKSIMDSIQESLKIEKKELAQFFNFEKKGKIALGFMHFINNKFDKAEALWLEGSQEESPNRKNCLIGLGHISLFRADVTTALEFYQTSKPLWENESDFYKVLLQNDAMILSAKGFDMELYNKIITQI